MTEEEVPMGSAVTDTPAEQELREYLLKNCKPVRLFPNTQPYLILQTPRLWNKDHEKTMSAGRVIRILPKETYGDYIVKR